MACDIPYAEFNTDTSPYLAGPHDYFTSIKNLIRYYKVGRIMKYRNTIATTELTSARLIIC